MWSQPAGGADGYKLVTGFSESEFGSAIRIKRTLCIDPDRHLIVWESFDSAYTRLYTYSRIDQNLELAPEPFAFKPPDGSTLTDFELPTPGPLGMRGLLYAHPIVSPRVVVKKEPAYGETSRRTKIEGSVILYVVISAAGKPSDVLVYRGLSPDLDDEAVKTVGKWRFAPAMSNGKPIAIPVMIDVNFKLR